MRQLLRTISIVLFLIGASAQAGEWHEGGTLHKATLGQWQSASAENRLATAADFISAAVPVSNMDDVLVKATSLALCINEVSSDSANRSMKVSEVGVMCIITLGYQ